MGEIRGETWVEKPDFLAPVLYTLTEIGGSVEVVGGIVEYVNKGEERGILVCCCQETGGGQGEIVIGVVVVLGDGGGEGI